MQLRKLKARTSYRAILDIFQKINPTPPTFRGKDTCIVLDPGHGGSATLTSNGASYYGTHEKNINLTLALLVAQKLRDEYKFTNVHLTRTEDKDVSLDERVTFAYKNNAAIFVSLHANAVENPQERQTTSGIETYFYKFQPEESSFFFLNTPSNEPFVESVNDYQKKVSESSKALATNIQASLSITTEANDRGVKDAKFFVVAQGQIIATLSEVGFLCNEEEHKKLVDPKYREKLASAICNGIISFLR
jgi:N-acetylmuramoyl-L-alanine amidase